MKRLLSVVLLAVLLSTVGISCEGSVTPPSPTGIPTESVVTTETPIVVPSPIPPTRTPLLTETPVSTAKAATPPVPITTAPIEKPSISPTPEPKRSPTLVQVPTATPTALSFELLSWEVIEDSSAAALQIRFAVNRQTQIRILNPGGEVTGTSPAIEPIERQATVRIGKSGTTPESGKYQLYIREGTRWLLARELSFAGYSLSFKNVLLASRSSGRNQYLVDAVRFTVNNTGDLPAYFSREMRVKIMGTEAIFINRATTPMVAAQKESFFEATGQLGPFPDGGYPIEFVLALSADHPLTFTHATVAGIP